MTLTAVDDPATDGNPCQTLAGASDNWKPFGQDEELKGIFHVAPSVAEYLV